MDDGQTQALVCFDFVLKVRLFSSINQSITTTTTTTTIIIKIIVATLF